MKGEGKRGTKINPSYGVSYKKIIRKLGRGEGGIRFRLSTPAVQVIDSLMNDLFDRITTQASQLARIRSRKTLTDRDLDFAVKLVLPHQIAHYASRHGKRALTNFKDSSLTRKNNSVEDLSGESSLEYSVFYTNVRHHSSVIGTTSTSEEE